jgi:hypothetical protein
MKEELTRNSYSPIRSRQNGAEQRSIIIDPSGALGVDANIQSQQHSEKGSDGESKADGNNAGDLALRIWGFEIVHPTHGYIAIGGSISTQVEYGDDEYEDMKLCLVLG